MPVALFPEQVEHPSKGNGECGISTASAWTAEEEAGRGKRCGEVSDGVRKTPSETACSDYP
ncbi:MAG: hypothetical protein V8T90_16870 [Victivallales bacterium]